MGILADSRLVSDAWAKACKDAGATPGTTAWLFALPGMPPTMRLAQHLEPGTNAVLDDLFRFSTKQLAEANSPQVRGHDRIAIYPEAFSDQRELLATLRHELEHSLQWRSHPEAYKASEILESALIYADIYHGPGGNSLINALPIEADANAAGAKLARDVYGPIPEELLWGAHGAVLRPQWQPRPETLGVRTIAWAAMHLAAVERACADRGMLVATLAENVMATGAAHLKRLAADAELQRAVVAAKQAIPSAQAIAAARSPAAAWTEVVDALRRGEAHATAVIARVDAKTSSAHRS